jgi:hypothetical protein
MTTKAYSFTSTNGVKLPALYPGDFTLVPGFLGTADFEIQSNRLAIVSGGVLVSNSSAKTDQSVSLRPLTVNNELVIKLRAATNGDAYTATILFNGAVGVGRNGTTIQNFFGVFSNNGTGANLITFEAALTPTGVELILKKDGVILPFNPASGIVSGRYIDPSPIAVNDIKLSFETGSVIDDLTITYAPSLLQVPAQPIPGVISAVTTNGFTAAWSHGVGGATRSGYEARYRYKANAVAAWLGYTNLTASAANATVASVASDANLNGQLIGFEVRAVAAGPEYSEWVVWPEFWALNGSTFGGGELPLGLLNTTFTATPSSLTSPGRVSLSCVPGTSIGAVQSVVFKENSTVIATNTVAPYSAISRIFDVADSSSKTFSATVTSVSGATETLTAVVGIDIAGIGSIESDRTLGGTTGTNEVFVITVLDANGIPAIGQTVSVTSSNAAVVTASGGVTDSNGRISITASYISTGLAIISASATRGGMAKSIQLPCFVQQTLTQQNVATIESSDTNPKFQDELFPYVFDFSEFLGSGESILSVIETTSQSLPLSKDAFANQMLIGDPAIFGQKVVHFVKGGLPGIPYVLRCTARTSLGSIATAEIRLKIYSQKGQRARII